MRYAGKIYALSLLATLLCWTHAVDAQPKPKDAECLACHSDPTLASEPDAAGKRLSLYVDADKMHASIIPSCA